MKKSKSIFFDEFHGRDLTVKEYVEKNLDGTDYERGSVETAQAQANNVSEAFARLISTLFDHKKLQEHEIEYIVKGW